MVTVSLITIVVPPVTVTVCVTAAAPVPATVKLTAPVGAVVDVVPPTETVPVLVTPCKFNVTEDPPVTEVDEVATDELVALIAPVAPDSVKAPA